MVVELGYRPVSPAPPQLIHFKVGTQEDLNKVHSTWFWYTVYPLMGQTRRYSNRRSRKKSNLRNVCLGWQPIGRSWSKTYKYRHVIFLIRNILHEVNITCNVFCLLGFGKSWQLGSPEAWANTRSKFRDDTRLRNFSGYN